MSVYLANCTIIWLKLLTKILSHTLYLCNSTINIDLDAIKFNIVDNLQMCHLIVICKSNTYYQI